LTIGRALSTKITLQRNIRQLSVNTPNVYPQDKGPNGAANTRGRRPRRRTEKFDLK